MLVISILSNICLLLDVIWQAFWMETNWILCYLLNSVIASRNQCHFSHSIRSQLLYHLDPCWIKIKATISLPLLLSIIIFFHGVREMRLHPNVEALHCRHGWKLLFCLFTYIAQNSVWVSPIFFFAILLQQCRPPCWTVVPLALQVLRAKFWRIRSTEWVSQIESLMWLRTY